MTGYDGYRARRLLAPLLIVVYLAGAMSLRPVGKTEFFPFFNWSLFPKTTAERVDSAIRVLSINGQPLEMPQLYYEMTNVFASARRGDATLMKLVRQIVHAERRGDQEAVEVLRRVIEDTFMRDVESVAYDLVIIRYDPILRYQSGEVEVLEVVGSYAKAAP